MKEEVIRCATRLFLERGINGVALQDIANEAGLSKGALYHYFDSREELLRQVFGDWVRTEIAALRSAIPESASAEEQMRAYVHHHVSSVAQRLDLYSLSFSYESELPRDVRAEFRQLKRESDQLLRKIIERGVSRHEFEPRHEMLIVFAIDGICNWMWKWYRSSGSLSPANIADEFSEFILCGLRTWHSAPPELAGELARDDHDASMPADYHVRAISFHARKLEEQLSARAVESTSKSTSRADVTGSLT